MTGQVDMETFQRTQRALREAAGQPPERFETGQVVSMLSDEIEALRKAGRDDAAIARMIAEGIGQPVEPAMVAEHYTPPEERQR